MRFLGIDLAWHEGTAAKRANESGVVAIDEHGVVVDAGWTVGLEETVYWVQRLAVEDTLLFVDAPLVVENRAGTQRLAEKQVGERYGRWKVAANTTNVASKGLMGVSLRSELERRGWRYDDGRDGQPGAGRSVCECYPYTTIVGACELGYTEERPRYKRKPKKMPVAEFRPLRAAACDDLIARMGTLISAVPPLDLRSHPETERLVTERSPLTDREYKHREDLIDAALCAWTASLWHTHGPDRCQVLGLEDPPTATLMATIIAPARPEQRREPTRYLKLDLPPLFTIDSLRDNGEWIEQAVVYQDACRRIDDGSYVCTTGGVPIILRAIRIDGERITSLDGGDNAYTYRIATVSADRIREQGL